MKILVAEDDLASRKFLSELLAGYGEVDRVLDGLEALDAYLIAIKEEKPYELICLDIMMPKLDGVKVLKAIRDYEIKQGIKPDARVKVVITTALVETEYVRRALEIGVEAYIAKPIDTPRLKEVITGICFPR